MDLRTAEADDALEVLSWRNDPVTRAMSRDPALVDREAHLAWFAKALADPGRLLLIGEVEGRRVGIVRFDRAATAWEAAINLAPEARGRGLGRALLRSGLEAFAATHPGAEVEAVVKAGNAPSVRLFEAAGFQVCGTQADLIRYRLRRPQGA